MHETMVQKAASGQTEEHKPARGDLHKMKCNGRMRGHRWLNARAIQRMYVLSQDG